MKHFTSRLVVWLIVAGMAAGSCEVLAQETIGLYFDEQGLTTEATTTNPYQPVQAWLLVKGLSQSTGISGWECNVGIETAGPAPLVNWVVQGTNVNLTTPPSFSIGLSAPLPQAPVIALATATVVVIEPGQKISFKILPFDPPSLQDPPQGGYPVYKPTYASGAAGTLYPLETATGCSNLPVAYLNNDGADTAPVLSGVPNVLYFDSDAAGTTATANIHVANPSGVTIFGEIQLAMEGCTYKHSDGAYTDAPTTFRIGPNGDLFVNLSYISQGGLRDGLLTLSVCGQEYVVQLHGGGHQDCVVSLTNYYFGDVPVGSRNTISFRVTNYGDYPFDATPSLGEDCTGFAWAVTDSTINPGRLLHGDRMYVEVTFNPLFEAVYSCTLTLGDGSCHSVDLLGRGLNTPPTCSGYPSLINFGNVIQDSTRTRTVTVTNTGGGLLAGNASLSDTTGTYAIISGGGAFELAYEESHSLEIAFTPSSLGTLSAELDLGSECGPVELTGTGINGVEHYNISLPGFGVAGLGQTEARFVNIYNDGDLSISGDMQISGDPSFSLPTPGPFVVPAHSIKYIRVNWLVNAYGVATAQVSTGLPGGEVLTAEGFGVEAMPGPANNLGFYFDPAFSNRSIYAEAGTTLPGYLVVDQPSHTIGGWEFQLFFAGDAQPVSWSFTGDATGILGPNDFLVNLASPLPTEATVVLATTEILVPSTAQTQIIASPRPGGPIPGYGSYVDANQPGNNLPLGETYGGILAAINSLAVGVTAPAAPTAHTEGRAVVVSWNCQDQAVDGYHVYRSLNGADPVRLTSQPLGCENGRGEFRDQPQATAGTPAAYTLTWVDHGVESSPSLAVEVSLPSGLPALTHLLTNYPNPFNPSTTVPFEMARPGHARLGVYDAAGKLVRILADGDFPSGLTERVWQGRDENGRRVPSGVYYLRLATENNVSSGKILLLK